MARLSSSEKTLRAVGQHTSVFAVKSQVLENEDCQGNRDGRMHFTAIPFGVADASGFVLVGNPDEST